MVEAEETTKSGIILAGAAKEKPQVAEIMAVGPGGVVDGKEIKMEVKVGDKVLISKYAGTEAVSYTHLEREFQGKGYGDFKVAVGQAVADHLRPVRENFERFYADKAYLKEVYTAGAERALRLSGRTLEKVYKEVGLVPA